MYIFKIMSYIFFVFIDQLHLCKHFKQHPSMWNCEVQHLAFDSVAAI